MYGFIYDIRFQLFVSKKSGSTHLRYLYGSFRLNSTGALLNKSNQVCAGISFFRHDRRLQKLGALPRLRNRWWSLSLEHPTSKHIYLD